MSQITKPTPNPKPIKSVSDFLDQIDGWLAAQRNPKFGYHGRAWFRGQADSVYKLTPGVYREPFTNRANKLNAGSCEEERRLNLEREMIRDFRVAGAPLYESSANSEIDVYFTAQHHGMPTRLLDWTTNPLTALFFATTGSPIDKDGKVKDGEVFVMEPTKTIPQPNTTKLTRSVFSMRNPLVIRAIKESFWDPVEVTNREAFILPVLPDNQLGRIRQQGSCFTLHMHKSIDVSNDTLALFNVPSGNKAGILKELHRLNINQFTIYNDLDHLSKEVIQSWDLAS